MASFRGHLSFSASLGAVYGGLAFSQLGFDWGTSVLAAGLTAVGGMLPDLDSDSGVPLREMFNLGGVLGPLILLRRLVETGLEPEQVLVCLGVLYLGTRYGLAYAFRKLTVHRGMFHSVPMLLVAGLMMFLAYSHPTVAPRLVLAIGVMIGFFSHLLLDELCAVDFRGLTPKVNQFAGSALKLTSKSRRATWLTYALLLVLGATVFLEMKPRQNPPALSVPAVSDASKTR